MGYLVLLAIASSLLAIPAHAQTIGEEAKACVPGTAPPNPDYERYSLATEWPEEALRYKADAPNVSREHGRLRLALEGGRTVELMDCPYGDAGYQYLYERYDEPGRFYVIRTPANDDNSWTLVMRRTGRLITVHGAPVWAADKSRFLTVACSLLPERGALSVYLPSGDGLVAEAEIVLPCAAQSCSARWDFQSWISVSCTPRDDTGKKGAEFAVMRGSDGVWRRFGR